MIIVTYSVVEFCELIRRNKSRAAATVEMFYSNTNSNDYIPPRLPDVRIDKYAKSVKKIIKVFKKYNTENKRDICNIAGIKRKCLRFLLFDNNTKEDILLYDSKNDIFTKGTKSINKFNLKNKNSCNRKSKKRSNP